MAANGMSQVSIARAHGVEPQTVSNLFRQRWFAERVDALLAENHKSVMEMFRAENRVPGDIGRAKGRCDERGGSSELRTGDYRTHDGKTGRADSGRSTGIHWRSG